MEISCFYFGTQSVHRTLANPVIFYELNLNDSVCLIYYYLYIVVVLGLMVFWLNADLISQNFINQVTNT